MLFLTKILCVHNTYIQIRLRIGMANSINMHLRLKHHPHSEQTFDLIQALIYKH